MRRVLPAAAALVFAAQLSAFGATLQICRMTGQVIEGCGCPEMQAGTEAPELSDRCCDELTTEAGNFIATLERVPTAPTLTVLALPLPPPALDAGHTRAAASFAKGTAPPRSEPLYLLERQLLI